MTFWKSAARESLVLLLLSAVVGVLSVSVLSQPHTGLSPLDQPASPYAWCDLGERLEERGDLAIARVCFDRARQLGPHIAPTLLRAANFYLRQGDPGATLSTGRQIMEQSDRFDQLLFSMYDHLEVDTSTVVKHGILPATSRQLAYLQYLLARGRGDRFCATADVARNLKVDGILDPFSRRTCESLIPDAKRVEREPF